MKAVSFKDQNVILAKDQKEYRPLPALYIQSERGEMITKWKIPFWQRFKVLFTGTVWVSTMTFNNPLQPLLLSTRRKKMYLKKTDKEYKKALREQQN